MLEDNIAVIDFVKKQFKAHARVRSNLFSRNLDYIDQLTYRADWGIVDFYQTMPAHYYEYIQGAHPGPHVSIDVVGEPHLVVTKAGAFLAPRPAESPDGTSYLNEFYEATPDNVERIVNKALVHLAQDVARRTLVGVAERLATKSAGFNALKKALALSTELGC